MRPSLYATVATLLVIACGLGACEGRGGEGADCPTGGKQATPSGYCVPRWLSLKRGEVYGRRGPGGDYPVVFVYHARGLPVQVVDETSEWRKICDPDGGVVWVSSAMVDGRRTVMAAGQAPLSLRKSPQETAEAAAYLRPRAIASLGRCQAGWCQVSAAGASGWVKQAEVWGLATQPLCR
jgi:SH3-like domain-containing protein